MAGNWPPIRVELGFDHIGVNFFLAPEKLGRIDNASSSIYSLFSSGWRIQEETPHISNVVIVLSPIPNATRYRHDNGSLQKRLVISGRSSEALVPSGCRRDPAWVLPESHGEPLV